MGVLIEKVNVEADVSAYKERNSYSALNPPHLELGNTLSSSTQNYLRILSRKGPQTFYYHLFISQVRM